MRQLFSRRKFLLTLIGGLAAIPGVGYFFTKGPSAISGKICGAALEKGHLLLRGQLPPPSTTSTKQVVIVGGGIAGLSAAWKMKKGSFHDFTLLELESSVGGNSLSGENHISAYPWGAHYVPIPGRETTYLRELFDELGVITGYDSNGRPFYNEDYLCFAPEERLYIYGRWQDGLLPHVGVSASDEEEYHRFFGQMKRLRNAVGRDGKLAFAIPLEESSKDAQYLALDRITMAEYLASNNYRSPYLLWYLNYCYRDDYGTPTEQVSAWAGAHYFAARRPFAANAGDTTLVTWPEGNDWIVKQLQQRLPGHIQCNALVWNIEEIDNKLAVDYFDTDRKMTARIIADYVIYAAPRFTTPHVLASFRSSPPQYVRAFQYAPWMIANVSLRSLPEDSSDGIAWDNVSFHSSSLGYVSATHQNLGQGKGPSVWTYYIPLSHKEPAAAREEALQRSVAQWQELVVTDLEHMHRDIRDKIENIDIWIWGHGMIRPVPGFIWGDERKQALQSIGRIYFAHSDMSGISIFEEAQYHGVKAAELVLSKMSAA